MMCAQTLDACLDLHESCRMHAGLLSCRPLPRVAVSLSAPRLGQVVLLLLFE